MKCIALHMSLMKLMTELNHQLKKLNHEVKKGDAAAETTTQTLTWPQLLTPPVRFQFSLYTRTHKHKYTHTMWLHLIPDSLPTQTRTLPTWGPVLPSSSLPPSSTCYQRRTPGAQGPQWNRTTQCPISRLFHPTMHFTDSISFAAFSIVIPNRPKWC